MSENRDIPPTVAAELAELRAALTELLAQSRANGAALTALATARTADHAILTELRTVVRDAAPLLNSRPVRALRGAGSVADYLKGGKR